MPNAKDSHAKVAHKILILGKTGSGKTTQFLTLPGKKFIYLFDPNAILTLQDGSDLVITANPNAGPFISATGADSASGVITFGIKAVSAGKYTLIFIVTCNELLPDGSTPYEFYVTMTIDIA